MSTDFYDDDIIPSSREIPSRPISDLPLTHMARHKQEVDERMVDKAKELERLRSRQAELERERRTLEELRAQQERFETLRRDSKKTLSESLVRLDQERQQADRLIEQLEETRRLFQSRLEEVDGIDEQSAVQNAIAFAGTGYMSVSAEQRYFRNQEAWYIGLTAIDGHDDNIYYVYVTANDVIPQQEIPAIESVGGGNVDGDNEEQQ